jgi:hypothetical protein
MGAVSSATGCAARRKPKQAAAAAATTAAGDAPRPLPVEIRGVHVTGALASLSGKFKEYVDYKRYGLNTIELDVKDEGGRSDSRLRTCRWRARSARTGSSTTRRRSWRSHRNGIYMIGRVVCFQDRRSRASDLTGHPTPGRERLDDLRRARLGQPLRPPGLGLLRVRRQQAAATPGSTRSCSTTSASLGRRHQQRRLPGAARASQGTRHRRLRRVREEAARPSGTRVSTRRLRPLRVARPRHRPGAPLDLEVRATTCRPCRIRSSTATASSGTLEPSTQPGETVFRTLTDFRRQVKGSRAQLVPWVQGLEYTPEQVKAQVAAARLQGAKGFLLWNASGIYTKSALAPRTPTSRAESPLRPEPLSAPGGAVELVATRSCSGSAGPARTRSRRRTMR